jgi:hypothetical protein
MSRTSSREMRKQRKNLYRSHSTITNLIKEKSFSKEQLAKIHEAWGNKLDGAKKIEKILEKFEERMGTLHNLESNIAGVNQEIERIRHDGSMTMVQKVVKTKRLLSETIGNLRDVHAEVVNMIKIETIVRKEILRLLKETKNNLNPITEEVRDRVYEIKNKFNTVKDTVIREADDMGLEYK